MPLKIKKKHMQINTVNLAILNFSISKFSCVEFFYKSNKLLSGNHGVSTITIH